MLTIESKKEPTFIDLKEFMRLKKDGARFEGMRQNAKFVNFAFLFGATARTFVATTLEVLWKEKDADNYIAENKLYSLSRKIAERHPNETLLYQKYLTCATDIRDKFFEAYPGLMERINRERYFALEHGYIRSWHGSVRRVPELFLMQKDEKGKNIKGDDRLIYGRMIGKLLNICANTTIQNFEAVLVMSSISGIVDTFTREKMDSFIFGSVHDSIDFYIKKDELEKAHDIIESICTEDWEEMYGMPQEIEMLVADITKDEVYKGGKDWREYSREGDTK
jgi:DNA polymerase I-like protein with 3'-5' exonuclease and polymerase domains